MRPLGLLREEMQRRVDRGRGGEEYLVFQADLTAG
jgi:hypothetical protein